MTHARSILSLILLLTVQAAVSYAQDTAKVINPPVNLKQQSHNLALPVLPQYPAGKDSLAIFIKENTHYPRAARKHHISGVIEVDFTVDTSGTIKNAKVLKSLGYGCDEEALRVVHLMPKWIPGRRGRDLMELDYHVNVPFGNQEQTTKKPKK